MPSKLILLVSCLFLVACADMDDTKETGITRDRAISIAKSNCPEYPDTFSFVDKAEWVPEKGYWAVLLDTRSGEHGRVYKINRNGEIVGKHDVDEAQRDYDSGPRGPGWWWY